MDSRSIANTFLFLGCALVLGVIGWCLIYFTPLGVTLLGVAGVVCFIVSGEFFEKASKGK